MNSLWEAAKRSPFLTSAQCQAKMAPPDNQLVANRTIGAAAAGKSKAYCLKHLQVSLTLNLYKR